MMRRHNARAFADAPTSNAHGVHLIHELADQQNRKLVEPNVLNAALGLDHDAVFSIA
jgi:hypothetical protein